MAEAAVEHDPQPSRRAGRRCTTDRRALLAAALVPILVFLSPNARAQQASPPIIGGPSTPASPPTTSEPTSSGPRTPAVPSSHPPISALPSPDPRTLPSPDPRMPVSFSADQIAGDAELQELSLDGHVAVAYGRFRLTSDRLTLRKTPHGIRLDGKGTVVFCPCPAPPVAIGFAGGLVGPPADLMLDSPSLRIGGVTVLAVPWLWLRAPSRPGVLPPRMAWRGADGLLLGDGVHVPWRAGEQGFDELDLTFAGYLRGGVEATAELRTAGSTTRVRWDRRDTDLVEIDAHGSTAGAAASVVTTAPVPERAPGAVPPEPAVSKRDPASATLAWDIDAIRGPRARAGTIDLDPASRAYDRAASEVSVASPAGLFGAGVRGSAPRGVSTGGLAHPVWGPHATFGLSGAMFDSGFFDALATLEVQNMPVLGPTHVERLGAGASFDARPGPFAVETSVRASAIGAASAFADGLDATGSARADVALPLVRMYGGPDRPFAHIVEPYAAADAMIAETVGAYWSRALVPLAPGRGEVAAARAGLRNRFGPLDGRAGAEIDAAVGAIQATAAGVDMLPSQGPSSSDDIVPAFAFRAAGTSQWAAFHAEGGGLLAASHAIAGVAGVRVGRDDAIFWRARIAGRTAVEPLAARMLTIGSPFQPIGGWFAAPGWTTGTEIGGRLDPRLGLSVGADADVSGRSWLDEHAHLSYRHPCRCLAADLFVARRLGRDGVDVWTAIDLSPN